MALQMPQARLEIHLCNYDSRKLHPAGCAHLNVIEIRLEGQCEAGTVPEGAVELQLDCNELENA